MRNDVLFLTLNIFSATGGIEKVCRVAGKALYEYGIEKNKSLQIYSMHDGKNAADENKYFPAEIYRPYESNKLNFVKDAMHKGCMSKVVIISHINLLSIGWSIKKLCPSTKLLLFAHGIEVWSPLSEVKKKMLASCDGIIAVSNFTKQKMQKIFGLNEKKITVLNNCLDPYLPLAEGNEKKELLLKTYGFCNQNKIIFTLARLSVKDRYKGYDKVLEAISLIKEKMPEIRYLLAGKYDPEEKKHIEKLAHRLHLGGHIVMPGFINDEHLPSHYALADLYLMPSTKEGFGIVFIEAMHYGLPVIGGNKDGTSDALCNGELGIMVDPENTNELATAMEKVFQNKKGFMADKKLLMEKFGYDNYKLKLNVVLDIATNARMN